jgi:hypothetical protein
MSNEPTGRSIGNLDTSEPHGLTDPAGPSRPQRAARGREDCRVGTGCAA